MKVLIVKLSSLGDVVHAMPAVQDIRAAHPDALIDWVVEPAFAEVLQAGAVEQYRGGDDRPGKAATPGLVGPRDPFTFKSPVMGEKPGRIGLFLLFRGHRCGSGASRWRRPCRSASPRAAVPRSGCRRWRPGCRPS